MSKRLDRLAGKLREYAFSLPEAYEDHPWGESVAKVAKKVFVFMSPKPDPKTGFVFSVKLPQSGAQALAYPFAEPTGYGLGKAGWVTVKLPPDSKVPLELLLPWVEESYRVIAPKKLVAKLDKADASRTGLPKPVSEL
jgi:predicted DNA-binding protein (MmcQ/YjbR family)